MLKWIVAALLLTTPVLAGENDLERVRIVDCYDGDSCWFDVLDNTPPFRRIKFRIQGIDTPERRSPQCSSEHAAAMRARARLLSLLRSAKTIAIMGVFKSKYDYAGQVMADGVDVAAVLLSEGLARPYDGKSARKGWCDTAKVKQ